MTKNIDTKLKESLLKELSGLQISRQASKVYLALFILEEAGISALERETQLHRQIIYNALDVLEKIGLVKHMTVNRKRRFSIHPLRRILALADEKRRLAESLIEQLNAVTQTADQEFEIYQGDSAFINHQFETLYSAEEKETLHLIGSEWEHFYSIMGKQRMDEYEKLRKGRGITIRYLGTESQRTHLIAAAKERPLFSYRILPEFSGGLVNTSIWNKSVIFNFLGNPVIAFVLHNESIAKSQLDFFESLWKLGVE
jgi:sugar-specific transcriptional regulator TrmB